MKKSNWGIILTIIVAILIFVLSIIPSDFQGERPVLFFKGFDKLAHVLMYGSLSFLVLNEYLKRYSPRRSLTLIIAFSIFLYSIIMELIQLYLIASRSGEWKDVLANLTGIVLGCSLIIIIRRPKY